MLLLTIEAHVIGAVGFEASLSVGWKKHTLRTGQPSQRLTRQHTIRLLLI